MMKATTGFDFSKTAMFGAKTTVVSVESMYEKRAYEIPTSEDHYVPPNCSDLHIMHIQGECYTDASSRLTTDVNTGVMSDLTKEMVEERKRIADFYQVFDFDSLTSWRFGRFKGVSFKGFTSCCNSQDCMRFLRQACINHYYSRDRDGPFFWYRCPHKVLPAESFEEKMSDWFNVDYFNLEQWRYATVRRLKDNGYLEFVRGHEVGDLCRRSGCLVKFRKWLCSRYDKMTEHDYFECIDVYEAQGKTNHHKKTACKRLKSMDKVYDFGRFYDMSDIGEVNELLRDVDTWLYKTRYPSECERFVDFVNSWMSQAHRRVAITVLGPHNDIAKMFMRASSGTLTQERLDKLERNQPQFLGELINLAQIMLIIYAIYMGHKHKGKLNSLLEAVTGAVLNGSAAAQDVSSTMKAYEGLVSGFVESCQATLSFLKDLVKSTISKLKDMAGAVGRVALEGLLTVILAFVAFEFARTMFPKMYFEIREWICAHFGFKNVHSSYDNSYEAQAGGGGVLEDILSFVSVNFVKKPKKFLLESLGDLPKLVSIAKALEWVCDNLGKLWNAIMESWTGQPIPKIKAESEMYAFSMAVAQLSAEMNAFSVDEVFSDELQIRFTMLDIEEKKLLQSATRVDKIRPVFTSKFVAACSEFRKVRAAYEVRMRTAKKRPVPVWLYIHGEPGVGKSTILPTLYAGIWEYVKQYADLVKGEFHVGHVYYLNQAEDFFDGYGKQFFTTIDDLFQSKDPVDRRLNAQRLIHMISPEPYSLRVATVEEKAHCFFESKCVVSTSNLPPKFEGQNVGLEQPSALSSRINLSLALMSGGKFAVDEDICEVKIDGQKKTFLTVEEVIAIVGEAIIQRNMEKDQEEPVVRVPRFAGELNSTRLKFEGFEAQALDKNDPVDVQNLKNYLARTVAQSWGVPAEIVETLPAFEYKDYDKDDLELLGYVMGILRLTGETHEEFTDRLGKYIFVRMCPKTKDLVAEVGMDPMKQDSWEEYLLKLEKRYARQEDFYAKRKKKTGKGKEKEAPAHTAPPQKQSFWRRMFDEPWDTMKEFAKNAHWVFKTRGNSVFLNKELAKILLVQAPGAILPTTDKKRPESMSEWIRSMTYAVWETYWKSDQEIDYGFWDEIATTAAAQWLDWEQSNTPVQLPDGSLVHPLNFFTDQYRLASESNSMAVELIKLFAVSAMIGYAIGRVIRLFMPATAYHHQGGPYDGLGKTKKTKPPMRRTKQRQGKRDRDRPGTPVAHAQGGNALNDLIMANQDIIEVRLGDKDDEWEDVKDNPPVTSSWILFVYSNVALVPGHTIWGRGEGKKRFISLVKNQTYVTVEEELPFIKELHGDIFLVKFDGLAEKRNILGLFADKVEAYGRFAHLVPHVMDTGYEVVHAWNYENKTVEVAVNDEYGTFETDLKFMGVPNERGMCGTVYTHVSTGKIVAIHMGGNPSAEVGLATSVLKGDLVPYDPRTQILNPIPVEMGVAQCLEGVQVLGMLPRQAGSFIPGETAFRLSKFDWKSAPVPETEDGPAHLRPFMIGEQRISPLNVALSKFKKSIRLPEPRDPERVSDILPRTFNPANVRVLSIEDAVYGIPAYMKSIDFTTSAGYFFKKMGLTRRDLCFDKRGEPRIHKELRRQVELRIHAASKDMIYPAVFEETLKDEIRSKEKNDKAFTRLFSAGDFASFIAQRMYLGTFFVEFTKDPVDSAVGLGINPHSKEWGQLLARLKGRIEEARRLGAGDFEEFDIGLKNQILRLFLRLVGPFFSPSDRVIVYNLIKANFAGYHVCGQYVFLRPWGTCSGSFITSMFNTFANWVMHKIAFIAIYPEEKWSEIEKTFTGDDSVFTSPEKYGEYNMEYLQKFFKEKFGMVYTSPTKTSDMNVTWEDATYLKRRFVLGHFGIMAPLAKRSLANMLKWTDTDQTVEVMQSVLSSLLLEAWHYGPSFYASCYEWSVSEAKRLGQAFCLPTFEEMCVMREKDF